ncbi:MAG: FAD-dependent oxidoreductase [Acidobacteriota bacterium]|nr:FAD-dependent oxidoreductase [Acidobacteriota bacterium]
MTRVAVVGAGISGLAAAYYLSRRHLVWVVEAEPRIGGHTHTVTVESSRGPLPIDTGFIVHNERTYPRLVQLFRELGVATQPSDMSFAVTSPATGFEYSSRGLRGFFAQRRNVVRRRSWELLREILRFNRVAPSVLAQEDAAALTLGDFLDVHRFRGVFLDYYLLPMASAIWSATFQAIRAFPAATLVRFFANHGMLGLNTHPQWRTVCGGSATYLGPLTAPYADRVITGAPVARVARSAREVTVHFADRPAMTFDQVVFACNGDRVLPLLESPTDTEREVLGCFTTSRNEVCLHTDGRLLPERPDARASWNYNLDPADGQAATVTYHMNRLQALDVPEDYCVTLNGTGRVDPARVLRRLTYHHPLFDVAAIRAQERWPEISGRHRTHFAGAYWFYGFHEDGLRSARRVARALGVPL